MDQLRRAFYTYHFRSLLLCTFADAFQALFWDLMGRRYRDDFLAPKAWGNVGDLSCDGILVPDKRCFACYAPENMVASVCVRKLGADFRGAFGKWQHLHSFEKWTFVHNARPALPSPAVQALYALGKEYAGRVAVSDWGPAHLEGIVLELTDQDAAELLGPAPTLADVASVGYEELKAILDFVGGTSPPPPSAIRRVPADKMSANGFCEETRTLLQAGETKAPLVGRFIAEYHDPRYGDRVCARFSQEYAALKAQLLSPDDIYRGLMTFAGGDLQTPPRRFVALQAVLTYLFDACEIFEAPRDAEQR